MYLLLADFFVDDPKSKRSVGCKDCQVVLCVVRILVQTLGTSLLAPIGKTI